MSKKVHLSARRPLLLSPSLSLSVSFSVSPVSLALSLSLPPSLSLSVFLSVFSPVSVSSSLSPSPIWRLVSPYLSPLVPPFPSFLLPSPLLSSSHFLSFDVTFGWVHGFQETM